MANYKAELVALFGNPVAENPTTVMHEAAFAELGLNWRYLTIEVLPEELGNAIRGLRAMNIRGANLTIPHKVEVLQYLDEISPEARLMGAVNTVVRRGDKLIGDNTDGKGFMRSLLEDAKMPPKKKNIVILGAGGAARAIAVELALAGAAKITIVNRTENRGQVLTHLLSEKTQVVAEFQHWSGRYKVPGETDIIINATSIGLAPKADELPELDYESITSNMLVCDVIPAPETPFLTKAKGQGAKTLDGLGMLVYQGVIGFEIWTGQKAPAKVMYNALAKAFGL